MDRPFVPQIDCTVDASLSHVSTHPALVFTSLTTPQTGVTNYYGSSGAGGAISSKFSFPHFYDCDFMYNAATAGGSGDSSGGAIAFFFSTTVSPVIFSKQLVSSGVGGDDVRLRHFTPPSAERAMRAKMAAKRAERYGGVFAEHYATQSSSIMSELSTSPSLNLPHMTIASTSSAATPIISHCTFIENSAAGDLTASVVKRAGQGGALSSLSSPLMLSNTAFKNNVAHTGMY